MKSNITNRLHVNLLIYFLLQIVAFPLFSQPISGTKTIGTGGTYSSLTSAFSAAITNGINGGLVFELLSNYSSSGETFPLVIGAITGSSSSNTITVRPQTGAGGLSISSSSGVATFQFNGCTNLIIDGRPGGSGSFTKGTSLAIVNTSSAAPALLYTNDTRFVNVQYCDLQSNNGTATTATTGGGIVCFGNTNGTLGNDYNKISFCDIHSATGGNPVMCVFGYGNTSSAVQGNDSNSIENCNIYDFNATIATAAISIGAGCSGWNIFNNRFYQTSAIQHTTAVIHRVIYITGGSGYTIADNFIGGNQVNGSGTYSINQSGATAANVFYLLDYASTVLTYKTTIKKNTITNLDYTSASTSSGAAVLVQIYGGNVDCIENLIGSTTVNGAIKFTSANATTGGICGLIGIRVGTGSNLVNLTGNILSGIDLYAALPTYSPEFHGINLTTGISTATYTATNNIIGSTTLKNSINIVSSCSGSTAASRLNAFIINNTQTMVGMTVANNIVANLNTNYAASGTQAACLRGIWFNPQGAGNFYINNNQVYHLSSASQTTGTGVNSALIGISVNTTVGTVSVSSNTVYSLHLTGSATSTGIQATGIFYSGINSSSNLVERNFIHHLQTSAINPSAIITGIEIGSGIVSANNNMISLGLDTAGSSLTTGFMLRGIVKNAASTNLYNNTIYIGGTGVATSINPTYSILRAVAATDDFRNNIIVNNRSNATTGGSHYQVYLVGTTSLTQNNNQYFGNGNGNVFGFNGTSDVTTYSSGWVSGDASSYAANPGLVLPAGNLNNCNLHITSIGNKGTALTSLQNDFDGDVRNSPPDIGADEIPFDIGVVSIDSPATASFCGQNRNIWIKFKNYGTTTITSAVFNLNVNGSLFKTFNWTGSLAPGATSVSTNIGFLNFFVQANYLVAINPTLPNGNVDNNKNNDTASANYSSILTVTPQINIYTPFTTVCTNSSVTFQAFFTHGGLTPQLIWRKNGVITGTNDTIYTTNNLLNNDTITVSLISSLPCTTNTMVNSPPKIMTVANTLTPTVTLFPNSVSICSGKTGGTNFQALVTHEGLSPHYQWQLNGNNVGSDSKFYTLSTPNNLDSVRCILTSSISCANKPKDTSAYAIVSILPNIVPMVSITATKSVLCNGEIDTFIAVTSGGSILWYKKNGGLLNSLYLDTLITNNLSNGDSIYAVLSASGCAIPKTVFSNKIGITVLQFTTPTATITASKNTICTGDSVVFNASYTSQGSNPVKSWYKNNNLVQNGSDSYKSNTLSNNDTIKFKLTSNRACLLDSHTVSNNQIVQVNPYVTPSVAIQSSATNICSGTSVVFSATPTNGGNQPQFIWRKNKVIIGTDSSQFTTSFLLNNDSIQVVMVSNATCKSKNADTSSSIKMTVNPTVTPTIQISTNTPAFCAGNPVTFSTVVNHEGTAPQYQWYKNNLPFGPDSSQFTTTGYGDKDTIYATLSSNLACATSNQVNSNKITLLMMSTLPASINITANQNNVCNGVPVTFTSSIANGGPTPLYQWKINGMPTGTSVADLIVDSLQNGDSVEVFMTSSSSCAVPAIAPSNKIGMVIKPLVTPKVYLSASSNSICMGQSITLTAADSNGGTAPKHTWLNNIGVVGTDSITYTSVYNTSQLIRCVLTSNIACASKTKDTASITVTVKPLPIRPVITRSADTLWSSIASTYQWSRNNSDMPSETNRIHLLTQNGDYKVTIDSNGCKNFSNTFSVVNLAVEDIEKQVFAVYPNPANDLLYIHGKFDATANTTIKIIDMVGKEIDSKNFGELDQFTNQQIEIGHLPKGTYILNIYHGNENLHFKISTY